MKLYVHVSGKVHLVSIDDQQTIGFLQRLLCERCNFQKVSLSKFPNGKEIYPEVKICTFFNDMDDVWALKFEEIKEEASHLKAPEAMNFVSLSKYSFYEYDSNWVRVEVPFEGIGKHDKSKIACKFDKNSFVLTILQKGDKNYQFSVLRLQCNIQENLCKYAICPDKIRISLRKVKDTDNWFSLFKAKTIGGDD